MLIQSSSLIRVEFVFNDATGGSAILSYNLQMADAYQGQFEDVVGGQDSAQNVLKTIYDLQDEAIQKGTSYSFRYRVLNVRGWSEFSDVTIVEAADVPTQPEIPLLVAYSSTAIELEFNLGMIDNNGSPITYYELQSDQGEGNGVYTKVESFPSSGTITHTLTAADDGITEGKIYKLRWLARNAVGSSMPSGILTIAAIDQFEAPATLTKDNSLSSLSSVHLSWSAVAAGQSPGGEVLGYRLQVIDTNSGTSWIDFDG